MESLFAKVDELIASQDFLGNKDAAAVLAELGTPSVSIAILSKGQIHTHIISNAKVEATTLYQACSISKPICGVAVFRAIQLGKLAIDASITDYLRPEQIALVSTPQTAQMLKHVTIGHILTHTAGFTVHGFPGYISDIPSVQTVLQGQLGSITPQIRLDHPPGFRFSYSGGGFTILQFIVETVFEKSYADVLQELVFTPLEMTRSCYKLGGETDFARAHMTGHTASYGNHQFPELAAAGLWTTPTDLLKIVRAVNASMEGDSDFLSQALARQLLHEVGGARGWTEGGFRMSEGAFGHSGSNDPGFRCGLLGLKSGAIEGLALMTNSALGFEVLVKITHGIAYLGQVKLGRSTLKPLMVDEGFIPLADRGKIVDDAWRKWRGRWELEVPEGNKEIPQGQIFELAEEEGKPVAKREDLPSLKLLTAAVSSQFAEGISLVVDGMEMMFRLSVGTDDKSAGGGDEVLAMELWAGSDPLMLRRLS